MSELEKNLQNLPEPWSTEKFASGRFEVLDLPDGGRRWVFKKNCSLTPRQLVIWYLSLCAITGSIAAGFWLAGFWIVLPFAGLELLLVGVAFLVYARHASDRESIEISSNELKVEIVLGARLFSKTMPPQWARLEYNGRFKAPLVLKCGRDEIAIGRFIAEVDKTAMHADVRSMLAKVNSATLVAPT